MTVIFMSPSCLMMNSSKISSFFIYVKYKFPVDIVRYVDYFYGREYNKSSPWAFIQRVCMDKPTDAQLIRSYGNGRDRAFQKLYSRYERPLFSFILKFMNDRQSAEDVFQQTWIKVIHGLPEYEEKGKFSSWLFGIAHNGCIDHARRVSRSRIDDRASGDGLDTLQGEELNPEGALVEREKKQWLKKAVDRLPEEQKEVVLLRLHAEIPFKEIAEMTGSPLNTVLGRMHYAVQNLKKMVTEEFGEDGGHVLPKI